MPSPIDPALLRSVARLLRQKAKQPAPGAHVADDVQQSEAYQRVLAFVASTRDTRSAIGTLPPQPATLRGRVGGLLVRLVERSLFWLLPQLRRLQQDTGEAASAQADLLLQLARSQQQNNERMKSAAELERRVAGLQEQVNELRIETDSLRERLERKTGC